jgi:hypothetical protein
MKAQNWTMSCSVLSRVFSGVAVCCLVAVFGCASIDTKVSGYLPNKYNGLIAFGKIDIVDSDFKLTAVTVSLTTNQSSSDSQRQWFICIC